MPASVCYGPYEFILIARPILRKGWGGFIIIKSRKTFRGLGSGVAWGVPFWRTFAEAPDSLSLTLFDLTLFGYTYVKGSPLQFREGVPLQFREGVYGVM